MKSEVINRVVVVGGGTAGWNAAALLVRTLGNVISVTLVESDDIGIVGVGEATIPPIINFNNALGIEESDFLKATQGSIKLGIQFENWGQVGDSYMHAFGNVGKDFAFCSFHNYWLRSQQEGISSNFWDFSLNYQTAKRNKFAKLSQLPGTELPGLSYAYHFDAGLYAKYGMGEQALSIAHRQCRCLRRPDRPAGVRRQQGRGARHDAADRARPDERRDSRQHDPAGHLQDADDGGPSRRRADFAGPAGPLPAPPRRSGGIRRAGHSHRREL